MIKLLINFFPECFKTQEMRDKAANTRPFVFDSIPDSYKAHEMFHKVFSRHPFMLKYCMADTKLKKCAIKLLLIFY